MNIQTRRGIVTAFATILVAATGTGSAVAAPDPGPVRTYPASAQSSADCPLERVGTQLVRCDNLTGAGVPATEWVPELGTTP
jgi:hypothetical protein